jgi:hypothetical protein
MLCVTPTCGDDDPAWLAPPSAVAGCDSPRGRGSLEGRGVREGCSGRSDDSPSSCCDADCARRREGVRTDEPPPPCSGELEPAVETPAPPLPWGPKLPDPGPGRVAATAAAAAADDNPDVCGEEGLDLWKGPYKNVPRVRSAQVVCMGQQPDV